MLQINFRIKKGFNRHSKKEVKKMNQITIRSDRQDDYKFFYKGEEVVLGAGKIISIANGLNDVVLPTCAMKIINNLIVIKEDVKHKNS